jgi:hypothetical protein
MAGTIITDRIESDATYDSKIELVSPVLVSNTFAVKSTGGTGVFNIVGANTNTDRTFTLPDNTGTIVASGTTPALNGIAFPATQVASANANTLDDYEEGTWTPSLGGNTTYFNQSSTYTKIGNLVFIRGNLHINAIGTGNRSQISGLPFAADESNQFIGIGYFAVSDTSVYSVYFSTSLGTLLNSRAQTSLDAADSVVNVFQNSTQILFSGVYRTS